MACEQAANRIEALEAERDMLRDALAGTESIILFQQAQLKAYEEMAPPRDPDLLRKRLDEIKARKEY
jgi:transcriptional regulator of met regulon